MVLRTWGPRGLDRMSGFDFFSYTPISFPFPQNFLQPHISWWHTIPKPISLPLFWRICSLFTSLITWRWKKKNSALTYIFHYDLIKYFESCEISLPVMHWLQPINVAVWCSKCWSFLNFCFNFKFLSGNNFCLFFWFFFFLEGNGGDGSEFFF